MNTRSFFKSLAMLSAGAAIAGPGIFIPKFEPVRWKASNWPPPHCKFFVYVSIDTGAPILSGRKGDFEKAITEAANAALAHTWTFSEGSGLWESKLLASIV